MSTAYQVIARKWRPQTFDDVVGQDHVVRTLRNAITRGRIAHAYLFVGPRGTGKTSTARIFAKALNCTGGPKADFDPNDPVCQAIADGSHLDVIEFDAATNTQVDKIRESILDSVAYAPSSAKFKIYIIDEVHMLSPGSFNALLKTLEEPPPHVKFVFATTDPQKMPLTVISRCQRFDLRPISAELIVEGLTKIAVAEKVKVTASALACIARLADGGMRDAQSILEQMISFCGGEITEPDVLDVYGLVAGDKITELAGALASGDHKKIVAIVDDCDASGRDLVRLLVDLQALVRGALLDAIAKGGKSAALGDPPMTTEQLTRMLDGLREGEGNVKLGLAEKINFEVTLLKAVESSRSRAIDSLIKELASLAEESPQTEVDGEKKSLINRLEARLTGALPNGRQDAGDEGGRPPAADDTDEAGTSVVDPSPVADGPSPGIDDFAESAFRAEAQGRGERIDIGVAVTGSVEEIDTRNLPPLDNLVKRIPSEVREALDELFRVKFVRVQRIPERSLK